MLPYPTLPYQMNVYWPVVGEYDDMAATQFALLDLLYEPLVLIGRFIRTTLQIVIFYAYIHTYVDIFVSTYTSKQT